jgi:hypothetical protein
VQLLRRLVEAAQLGDADESLNPGEIDLHVQSLGPSQLIVLRRNYSCACRINASKQCTLRHVWMIPYCDRVEHQLKSTNPGEPAMYIVVALLGFGAACVAFSIALFAGGALVGAGSLGMQALRAVGGSRDVKVDATSPKPAVRPVFPPEVMTAKTMADPVAAFAAA